MSGDLGKPTPVTVDNRAGLPMVRTRTGTHSAFYASMLRGLADANRPGLSELRARANGDFTLGLLDAWAGLCDTLTFYHERQANEAYLRTATERESIRAHARLIGYELAPAKAAGTFLAFTAEESNAPEDALTYPAGLQARSVPRDGEIPQIFETIEPLTARASWNAMRPRMAYPQVLGANSSRISLKQDAPRLNKGDPVVFLMGDQPAAFNDPVSNRSGFLRRVTGQHDGVGTRKIVELAANPTDPPPYIFIAHSQITTLVSANRLTTSSLGEDVSTSSWPIGALLTTTALNRISSHELTQAINALPEEPEGPIQPHVMRVRAGLFGNTAISKRTSPVENSKNKVTAVEYSTAAPGSVTATAQAVGDKHPVDEFGKLKRYYIYLDRDYPEITPGGQVIIRDHTQEVSVEVHGVETQSVEGYSMSAKVTRLEVDLSGTKPFAEDEDDKSKGPPENNTLSISHFKTRNTVVYAVPELLPLSDLPIETAVGASDSELGVNEIELDAAYELLEPGKTVAIEGEQEERRGVQAAEIRTIAETRFNDRFTVLTFTQSISRLYVRDTVTVNANVAEATHGETVTEVLGDGDAAKPFQSFKLKSTPLTHVSAKGAGGMAPALEVRVDRVLWELAGDFRDAGPEDRVYLLRIDEDGTTRIVFGDGVTGQRLPTGQGNVEATYRKGAGLAGHLEAGQLSLLATKPVGLKGVKNPMAPAGAADAEALEDARINAPLKVLTLGRVVSLRDYEDFARSFAAIAKARADWTFDGFTRPIFVTVAGQGGAILPEGGSDMISLRAELKAAGEVGQQVTIRNYQPSSFAVRARLYIDPAYLTDDVKDRARETLLAAFSFDARALGQAVSHAQIIATLQSADGVTGVDLEALYRVGSQESLEARLVSAVAKPDISGAIPAPAELLTLDSAALTLEVA